MINWKLYPTAEKGGMLMLFDCVNGARFMIHFTEPTQLRRMLDDIIEGSERLEEDDKPTTLPEAVRREFPGRD